MFFLSVYKYSLFLLLLPCIVFGWSTTPDDVWVETSDLQYQSIDRQKYKASVFYGKSNFNVARQLHSPVVVLGRHKFGFDKHFDAQEFYSTINSSPNSYPMFDKLREQGRDIVIVDFDLKVHIQANSYALVKLLDFINAHSDDQITIMGFEIGGMISRYALTYMEQKTLEHNVALHFTFDTPHQGLNIPYALQWYAKAVSEFASKSYSWGYIPGGFNLNPLRSVFNDFESYTSLKQLMIVDYQSSINHNNGLATGSKEMICHNLRKQFLMELKNLGDHPQNTKNIAMSSGSIKGNSLVPVNGERVLFSHWYDHWGNFDWSSTWYGDISYTADPLRLMMSSTLYPLSSDNGENIIYSCPVYPRSITSYNCYPIEEPTKPHQITTSTESRFGMLKDAAGNNYLVTKNLNYTTREYGKLHFKVPQATYPFSVMLCTNIAIHKFSKGNFETIYQRGFNLTCRQNDPDHLEYQIEFDRDYSRQISEINHTLSDRGLLNSNGTVATFGDLTYDASSVYTPVVFEESVGNPVTGKYIYTMYGNVKVKYKTEGYIPSGSKLIGSFRFRHQQPEWTGYEIEWTHIPKINENYECTLNPEDYRVPIPTFEYNTGTYFRYKDQLVDFIKQSNFWGVVFSIQSYEMGGFHTSQVDVTLFDDNNLNFYLDKLCYISTSSALDIRNSEYTEANCLTQYSLATDKNTNLPNVNPKTIVSGQSSGSPYYICGSNESGHLYGFINTNLYDSYNVVGQILNEICQTALPLNLMLTKTSYPGTQIYQKKAKNNVYIGNEFKISGIHYSDQNLKIEAGSNVVIEPGTEITLTPGTTKEVQIEINDQLKEGRNDE